MELSIKKTDLKNKPCKAYDNLPDEFDAIEEIKKRGNRIGNRLDDVRWLIANCELAQTPEMMAYLKSLKPSAWDFSRVIADCEFAQTAEMLEYLKSLDPSAWDVGRLIAICKFAQTAEMLEYFKSLKPSAWDARWLTANCEFAQTHLKNKL